MTFALRKQDFARARQLRLASTSDARQNVIQTADAVRTQFQPAATLISDAMIDAWLQAGQPYYEDSVLTETALFCMLGWYYAQRTLDANADIAPGFEADLHHFASTRLLVGAVQDLPYTALMVALYRLRSDVALSFFLPGDGGSTDLLCWYYLNGIHEYRLERCVTRAEIAALNQPRAIQGVSLLCLLDLWALQRASVASQFDLGHLDGQLKARELAWKIRAEDTAFRALEPGRLAPAMPDNSAPAGVAPLINFPAPTLLPRHAEYLRRHSPGLRLLVPDEWHDPESSYVWGKAPVSSLYFCLAAPAAHEFEASTAMGLLFDTYPAYETLGQTISIYLNGRLILQTAVEKAVQQESILRNIAKDLRQNGTNLLQLIIDKPLIPSEHLGLPDGRHLGLPLRRLWIG